ncbi:DUF6300 family protein [Streptomyces sp. NPDC055085]
MTVDKGTFRTVPEAFVTGVWMDLCPACDAHRPAARVLICWYREPDRDPKALPQLLENWEPETMHTHACHGGREDRHRPSRVRGRAAPSPALDR